MILQRLKIRLNVWNLALVESQKKKWSLVNMAPPRVHRQANSHTNTLTETKTAMLHMVRAGLHINIKYIALSKLERLSS